MSKYFSQDNFTLILGDSLEELKKIKSKIIVQIKNKR